MKTKFNGFLTLLMALLVQITFAQEKTVTGIVSDASGPLPGVTVIIVGTTTGTQTDFDGNYSISVEPGAVLQFSFVGMLSVDKTVDDSNVINLVMQEDATELEEVVVTAFGIKRNPKNLGYAVSVVQSDDLTENSEPDLMRSLSGKVAGVNVNFSTGVAGAANSINIRGATTFGGNSQPLFIVDGVTFDNSEVSTGNQSYAGGGYESGLSSLDPNDIASVNVLKSAAAGALYGSRATNGVIVITTKSGAASHTGNKLKVSVSSGNYFENIANLPTYQNTYGNGTKFVYSGGSNGSWGSRFDSRETVPTLANFLAAFPELGPTMPYVPQPNNVKNLFRTGFTTDNSVNLAFGDDKKNFSVTISDSGQDGYIPYNTYDKTAFSLGGSVKVSDKFTVGGSFSHSVTNQIGGFFGENQTSSNTGGSSFARTLWLGRTWDSSLPFEAPDGSSVEWTAGYDNPLWSWKHDQILTNTDRTFGNINMNFQANDNISFSYRLGMNKYNLHRKQIRDISSEAYFGLGAIVTDDYMNEDVESTFLVNFDYDLTEDIGLSAIVGNSIGQNTYTRKAIIASEFIEPGIFTVANNKNIVPALPSPGGLGFNRSRVAGVFADLSFSFKDFIFLNATGRNDWSSTLPKNNNSYFYPSISTSIIFTEALGLESDVLTFGKLRAGYASVGNTAPTEFLNRTFAPGNDYRGVPVIGNRTSLGDTELTPEFTDEVEIGVDLEFFRRRVVVDFSWYKKTTTDLISAVTVPSTSGFTSFNTNIGEMENKGIEIGLTLVPLQNDDFKWTAFTTFTKNKNEVLELIEGLERIVFNGNEVAHAIVGEPFGVFYGTQFARVDQDDPDSPYIINKAGGGIVEAVDSGIIGDPTPDFKMSFINSIQYKNFTLRGQFDWTEGGDISSTSIQLLLGRGVTKDTEDRERTVIIPGFYGDGNGVPTLDGSGNMIPNTTQLNVNDLYFSPPGGNTFAINSVDEADIYDATVYRLRELSLSYTFPDKWLEKIPFSAINISAVANNLWYFAPNVPKYTNFDPDVTSFGGTRLQGIEIAAAPTATRYGFKVNLTF